MRDEVKAFRPLQKSKFKPSKKLQPQPRSSAASKRPLETREPAPNPPVPLALQQRCLSLFRAALYTGPEALETVQAVKGHLFARDFAQAFGMEGYRRAYALRWSAGRAVGYLRIFTEVFEVAGLERGERSMKALCLGAGAGAEVVGLAGWMGSEMGTGNWEVEVVDRADWSEVVGILGEGVVASPVLGKYASNAAREANRALVQSERFGVRFTMADVLDWDEAEVKAKTDGVGLVTVMFTLNELYTTSVAGTQRVLALLTTWLEAGAMLLVVDSPGSYSTVSINGTEKKYPMQWLLDYTLMGSKDSAAPAKWERLVSENSKWFRMPEGLEYPIELESMRYQLHLYRRLDGE